MQAGGIAVEKDPSAHWAHGERGRGPWARPPGQPPVGSAHLEDIVRSSVHASVLDSDRQLAGSLARQKVLADEGLGELGPLKVLQS